MSDEDKELEILKAKRLAEMQKNLSNQEKQKDSEKNDESVKSLREYVIDKLGHRGLEVLETAEFQFPNQTRIVIEKLGDLIAAGEISEILDGGKLLTLFRSVGISVRLDNKINVEKDGKFVSITDKFKDKSEKSNDE